MVPGRNSNKHLVVSDCLLSGCHFEESILFMIFRTEQIFHQQYCRADKVKADNE